MKCLCWQTLNEEQGAPPHRHLHPLSHLCYFSLLMSSCGLGVTMNGCVVLLLKVTPPLKGKWNMSLGGSFFTILLFTVLQLEHLNLSNWPLFFYSRVFVCFFLFFLLLYLRQSIVWPEFFCERSRSQLDQLEPVHTFSRIGVDAVRKQRQAEFNTRAYTPTHTHTQLFSSPPLWADRKWHLISIKALGIHWIFFPS